MNYVSLERHLKSLYECISDGIRLSDVFNKRQSYLMNSQESSDGVMIDTTANRVYQMEKKIGFLKRVLSDNAILFPKIILSKKQALMHNTVYCAVYYMLYSIMLYEI